MNKSTILAFVLGATVGSVVTWQLVKVRYAQIAQEEIDSVKEVFSKREELSQPEETENTEEADVEEVATRSPMDKPSLAEYAKKLSEAGYTNYANSASVLATPEDTTPDPYIITYEDFGELDGYTTESLNFYSDNVLTDDWDNVIPNANDLVGAEFRDYLLKNGSDADIVYVRNDGIATDYEIVYSVKAYSDVYSYNAPQRDE